MSTRKFTEEDIDEMVFLAKKFNSYRKAALEFGCSYQTIADRCHKRGVHIAGPHELCKKKKQLAIDGHTFYWNDKGYYRGSVNGERIMLADYRYRQMFGTQKPKGIVIMFKDGNRDNYDVNNIYFISTSEYMRLRNKAPEIHARNIELLNKGREDNIARESKRPWLAKKRLARAWTTRRERDPEGTGIKKMVETRRRNAEERGYWYTEEQRLHFSAAHKGITREKVQARKHEAEKAVIRAKMGMR